MEIIKVQHKSHWRQFHEVPTPIYRNFPNWIRPLEKDIEEIFSPKTNQAFEEGDAQCFLLLESGKAVGRIAAFIDHGRNKKQDYPTGGLGFFECPDNQEMANKLFDTALQYLAQWEVKAVDGPINFGEREKFWGLLVKNDDPPLHLENYHPPYYKQLFENYGFQPFEQVLTLKGLVADVPDDRFKAIATRAKRRYNISTTYVDLKQLNTYANHFSQIYNAAFHQNPYFKPLPPDKVLEVFKTIKPIVDPKAICFAYHEDRPIGFCILLPDINEFLKPLNGKFKWWHQLSFLFRFKRAPVKLLKGLAFGVDTEFQKKGVYAIMVDHLYTPYLQRTYKDVILATIRGHNELMIKSTTNLGVNIDRIHIGYRKMLDDQIPLEPFAFVEDK